MSGLKGDQTTLSKCLVLIGVESRRRWIALVLLAAFVSALEAVAAMLVFTLLGIVGAPDGKLSLPVIGDLYSHFPALRTPRGIVIACVGIGLFFLFRAMIYLYQSYRQNKVAYGTSASLARQLLSRYLSLPYQSYLARNSSELIRNAHESTISLAAWVLFPGILLGSEVFVIIALATVLLVTSPLAAFGTFFFLALIVLSLLRTVQPRLLTYGKEIQDLSAQSLQGLQEALLGLRDIRVLKKESFFISDFASKRIQLSESYALRGLLIDVPRITLESSVLVALLIIVGAQAMSGNPLGESTTLLGMFGYAALRVLPSVNRIVNSLQSLKFSGPLIDALYEDMKEPLQRPSTDSSDRLNDFVSLEVRDVSFRYDGSTVDALRSVNLSVDAGEFIGLVGSTGSGKSTLVDLILGLLSPSEGLILVNGEPIAILETAWRSSIGLVPQTTFLIDDSIRRNIALGLAEDDIDSAQLQRSITIAELSEFVNSLPEGVDTKIGERGMRISGGQRQRLAIARAIYFGPEVLVLDEGTAALDEATEAKVLNNILTSGEGTTVLHVTHRLSTVRRCDRIVFLTNGKIDDIGTFEDLVRRNSSFNDIARSYLEA